MRPLRAKAWRAGNFQMSYDPQSCSVADPFARTAVCENLFNARQRPQVRLRLRRAATVTDPTAEHLQHSPEHSTDCTRTWWTQHDTCNKAIQGKEVGKTLKLLKALQIELCALSTGNRSDSRNLEDVFLLDDTRTFGADVHDLFA